MSLKQFWTGKVRYAELFTDYRIFIAIACYEARHHKPSKAVPRAHLHSSYLSYSNSEIQKFRNSEIWLFPILCAGEASKVQNGLLRTDERHQHSQSFYIPANMVPPV